MILVWTCLFAALGGFLFGYDLGLIGGALLQIERYFAISSSLTLELVVGAAKLGAAAGTFLGGAAMARYGRQRALALNSVAFAAGPVIMAAASAPWMLILGRFVVGLGIGVSATVSPAYIAELAPAAIRGTLVQLYEVMLCIGMLTAPLVDWALSRGDPDTSWRVMVGLPALPGLLLAVTPLVLPESPRWLVMRNRLEEALSVLTKVMRGSGSVALRGSRFWSGGYSLVGDKRTQARFQPVPARRHARLVVSAGRALGQEKRSAKKEEVTGKCPCGTGLQYQECCGPIVAGAWARTAPELARARFTALLLEKARMLADTTHPEALAAIGTKRSLLKKMEQLMQRRGMGDDELRPALADCVHGQSTDDPDSWFVLLAISHGPPGLENVYTFAEQYKKDAGRWWYVDSPPQFPVLDQFHDFLDRYNVDNQVLEPVRSRYSYDWATLPPRARSPAWMQQQRERWLVDDWPSPAEPLSQQYQHQHPSAKQQQQQQHQQQQAAGGWAYLDTARDPDTGLTAAQTAAQTHRLLELALHEPQMDWDSYYFRFGRFFS